MASSPCSSDSRYILPFSSGSVKSGSTAPGVSPLLIMSSLALALARPGGGCGPSRPRADAGDGEPDPVDGSQRGDVERAAVVVAPGEVVGALRQAQRAEMLTVGGEEPDASRPAHVEVADGIHLDP